MQRLLQESVQNKAGNIVHVFVEGHRNQTRSATQIELRILIRSMQATEIFMNNIVLQALAVHK